jgi:hypothetical protein
MKERLGPKIAEARFGWRPTTAGRILIVPGTNTIRRIVDRHEATMAVVYPARTREVKAWLRRPCDPIRGIWFMSEVASGDAGSDS